MRKAGWYVIQVQTGSEPAMCRVIERACAEADVIASDGDAPILEECFSPRYRTRAKYAGEWRDIEKLLLPGYVIAVAHDPDPVRHVLQGIQGLTKMLAMGETFVPLRDDERVWIEEWTQKGDRAIPLSIAYREGDALVVTQGPLKGSEGRIVQVNRKKCLAYVELDVGGKRVRTAVGLAIVPGRGTRE